MGRSAEEIRERRFTALRGSSINDTLFGDRNLVRGTYVVVVESRLDALALTSFGYPAVVTNRMWPELDDLEIIIVPDNDGGKGELIAIDRQEKLGGRLLRLPAGCKDVGELILTQGESGLVNWFRLPKARRENVS